MMLSQIDDSGGFRVPRLQSFWSVVMQIIIFLASQVFINKTSVWRQNLLTLQQVVIIGLRKAGRMQLSYLTFRFHLKQQIAIFHNISL